MIIREVRVNSGNVYRFNMFRITSKSSNLMRSIAAGYLMEKLQRLGASYSNYRPHGSDSWKDMFSMHNGEFSLDLKEFYINGHEMDEYRIYENYVVAVGKDDYAFLIGYGTLMTVDKGMLSWTCLYLT